MTILPLVDCEIVDTNVTDNTAVFNNNIQQNYPLGTRYQENNNIYENMGADIVVPAYSAEGTYTVGQIVYKDSKVSKCTATSGEVPKQPEEYTAVDTSFDDSVWTNRYMKLADITADLPLNVKNVVFETAFTAPMLSADRTKLYIAEANGVKQYSLSTAGDIETATYINTKTLTEAQGISKMFFKADGLKLYVLSPNDNKILQYNLSTAWDTNTAIYNSYKATYNIYIGSFTISSDGTKLYQLAVGATNTIYQSTLSTAWSISTAGSTSGTKVVNVKAKDISFSTDGTKLYMSATTYIYQWTVSTAWNVSTATQISSISLSDMGITNVNFETVYFSTDGTQIFFDGQVQRKTLYRATITTAWDITTTKYSIFPIYHVETRGGITYTYQITRSYSSYYFSSSKGGVYVNNILMTSFTELNNSSVEEKAYIGSNGTWVAKTLVIRPTAIYIRTSIDKSIEYKTLTAYQFSVVTSPTELTGFSFYEKTNPYKPFDNKSYTVATIDNTMTYKIKALGKMDAVVLAHIKGDLVTVKFYDSTNTLQSEIVDYVLDGSIDSRDEHEHGYTTEIFYNMVAGVRTTIDINGYVEITLTDTNLELGTLSPCLSIDAGFLDLEMELSITDYSPYEVGIGGVVDYVEGIAAINANLTFYELITNFDKSARRMIALKRQVVAIDGSSSMNREPDTRLNLFNSTKLLGRMDKISMRTVKKDGRTDKFAKITTNILEVS